MAEKTKNLCAQIPEDLHNRVREEQERSGQTLSQYVTWLITTFYEGGRENNMGETRTLAVQMPADLFERLDKYLADHKLKKKAFIIDLITRALEETDSAE
jgi:predicted DNA-binding protein